MNDLKINYYKCSRIVGGRCMKNTRWLVYIMLVRVPEASKKKEVLTG